MPVLPATGYWASGKLVKALYAVPLWLPVTPSKPWTMAWRSLPAGTLTWSFTCGRKTLRSLPLGRSARPGASTARAMSGT